MEMARVGLDKDKTECRAALNAIEDDDEADEELGRVGQTKTGWGYEWEGFNSCQIYSTPIDHHTPTHNQDSYLVLPNVPVKSCHFSTKYLFPVEYL